MVTVKWLSEIEKKNPDKTILHIPFELYRLNTETSEPLHRSNHPHMASNQGELPIVRILSFEEEMAFVP